MESKLQAKIIKDLESKGYYVLKISLCNKPGHPDLEAARKGKIIYLEIKDDGKKPSILQEYRHEELRNHGFKVYVFDNWMEYVTTKL